LASQPAAKERAEVLALLDAVYRLSERREATQSQCGEDLETKLLEKRRELQCHVLGLLWLHVDLSKTHWRWLAQLASCLSGGSDQDYITKNQRHFFQEYGKCDICITPSKLESGWCWPKSILYTPFSTVMRSFRELRTSF